MNAPANKILIAGRLHPAGVSLARSLEQEGIAAIDYIEEISEASYIPRLPDADALVLRTQPLTAETIASAPRLKVVSRHGVGYDAIDLPALNARSIALAIVGDVNSASVAEHAMTFMLAAAKRFRAADQATRDPTRWEWRNRLESRELNGKNLLIIGFGRIGRRLARMGAAFEMRVRAYDPLLEASGWPQGETPAVSDLREALGWADFVSLHIPKSDAPLIAAPEIARMKRGAILVNTARGGVVCERALADALASGHLAAAGLDVFVQEPPPVDAPLLALENIVLTPHNAGLTAEAGERMAVASVRNAVDGLAGVIDPSLVVNAAAIGYAPR